MRVAAGWDSSEQTSPFGEYTDTERIAMTARYTRNKGFKRRGSALPLLAVMCPELFAFAALSVDIGA